MSGGTPVGAKFMRQRHSFGYGSGGEDLEDDACSKPMLLEPSVPRAKSWLEIMENLLWIASAVFIIYFGDWHSNLIYLLWHDDRIRRIPLYIGFIGISLSVAYFFYTNMSTWGLRKSSENWEILGTSALPLVTLLGFISFCLFTWALWPIWSFLTLPLVFTLFMACTVLSPYLIITKPKPHPDVLRLD